MSAAESEVPVEASSEASTEIPVEIPAVVQAASEAEAVESGPSGPVNRRIVLAQRPSGAPATTDFRLENGPLPQAAEGQVLLRTLTLSLDPYMRGRMNDSTSYAPSLPLGATMLGATISRVVESRNTKFKVGDLVLAHAGWQDYAISDGSDLSTLPNALEHPSHALGALGMTGFTAYVGLLDLGEPQPGNTLVVAAATGAVGSMVGQIGKLKGCRVVGVAGGSDKCEYAVAELGFDACIDHYAADFAQQLKDACPQGVDIYFENVGGAVLEAVLPLLNIGARIPLCGLISYSNATSLPAGPDLSPVLLRTLLIKRVKLQGFIIFDHYARRQGAFLADMSDWLARGLVKAREDVIEGLQHAPGALMGLLRGDNFGKLLVKVADA